MHYVPYMCMVVSPSNTACIDRLATRSYKCGGLTCTPPLAYFCVWCASTIGSDLLTQEDVKKTRAGSGGRAKQDYWGALVLLNADGQSFDTVMAAINSSKCASCDVTLIVERKKGEPSKVPCL